MCRCAVGGSGHALSSSMCRYANGKVVMCWAQPCAGVLMGKWSCVEVSHVQVCCWRKWSCVESCAKQDSLNWWLVLGRTLHSPQILQICPHSCPAPPPQKYLQQGVSYTWTSREHTNMRMYVHVYAHRNMPMYEHKSVQWEKWNRNIRRAQDMRACHMHTTRWHT